MNGGVTVKVTVHTASKIADRQLQEALLQRVRGLSFLAYCHLIRLLLYRSGYTSVQIMEPSGQHEDAERLLYGGLMAVSHTDLASALTLVRVKQAKGMPVSRRFVDQLRGAMLRLGAEQGLLIATGRFSRYAIASASQAPLSPIRLVDGDLLCSMLMERRLGVKTIEKEHGNRKDTRHQSALAIDEAFFSGLEVRVRRHREIIDEALSGTGRNNAANV